LSCTKAWNGRPCVSVDGVGRDEFEAEWIDPCSQLGGTGPRGVRHSSRLGGSHRRVGPLRHDRHDLTSRATSSAGPWQTHTLFRIICSGKLDTAQPEWAAISTEVKDLLKGLLDVNPETRLTAADALNHTWFTANKECTSTNLRKSHMRLHNFADAMKLKVVTFEPGEFLVRQGEIGSEVFLIRDGICDVIVKQQSGGSVKVATRAKGDFIGEMALSMSDKESADMDVMNVGGLGKARTASVQAVTRIVATVLSRAEMQWAVDHDYRLDSEIQAVIKSRQMELRGAQ